MSALACAAFGGIAAMAALPGYAMTSAEDLIGVWVKNVSPDTCRAGVTFVKEGEKLVNKFKIGQKDYSFDVQVAFDGADIIEVTRSDKLRSMFQVVDGDTIKNFLNIDLNTNKAQYVQTDNLWHRCPRDEEKK